MLLFGAMILLMSAPLSLMCSGAVLYRSPQNFKKCLFLYVFAMSIIVYSCIPNYENDLIRYFQMIEQCKSLPFSQAFTWENDGLVVKNFVFWIISRLGDVHILPAVSSAIYYGVSAYLAVDQYNEGDKIYPIILFQLCTIPFLESLSNVRNVSAFALLILAAYRDMVKKDRGIVTILLYVLPCFVHMSGFVLVIFRLAVLIIRKHPIIGLSITLGVPSAVLLLFDPIRTIVSSIGGNIGLILNRAVLKSLSMSTNTSEYAQTMSESGYVNSGRLVNSVIVLCIIVLIVKYVKEMRQSQNNGKAEYAVFVVLICGISLIWAVMGTVKYWIFAYGAVVSSTPILMYFINRKGRQKLYERICLYGLQASAVLRLGLEIYYIRTRIYIAESLQGCLLNNVYTVISKALVYFIKGS